MFLDAIPGRYVLHEICQNWGCKTKRKRANAKKIVLYLLKTRKDVQDLLMLQDSRGNTPLHYACDRHTEVVELLLEHGAVASIGIKNDYQRTPLHVACRRNVRTVTALLKYRPSVNELSLGMTSPLHTACQYVPKAVGLLLEAGAIETINNKDIYKMTPLHIACSQDSVQVVEQLLDAGATETINVKDTKKWTPLHYACKNLSQVVPLLLEKGAVVSLNERDKNGWTPLRIACRDSPEIVELLLLSGAHESINRKDRNGLTPLHVACRHNPQVVRFLLEFGQPQEFCCDEHFRLFERMEYCKSRIRELGEPFAFIVKVVESFFYDLEKERVDVLFEKLVEAYYRPNGCGFIIGSHSYKNTLNQGRTILEHLQESNHEFKSLE